jgi:hypothetical protein
MAYTFSVNNSPSTGALAIYTLLTTLVSAGWVVKADSDGTTYNSVGGQITGGGSGTNGLANSNAWFRVQAPAVNVGTVVNQKREFTFQRGTTNLVWRIKYSASAGFTGGSPGSSQTPTATDEVVMTGGGTDASPTFFSMLPTDATYRLNIAAGGSTEFYSFIGFGCVAGSTNASYAFFLDNMSASSYPSSDVDPAVVYFGTNGFNSIAEVIVSTTSATSNTTNPAKARAWLGSTSAAGILTSGTNNQNINMAVYGSGIIGGTNTLGSNPFTNKDDLVPCPWMRNTGSTTPLGWKGFSTLFQFGSVARTNLDTADTAGSKDKIFYQGVWIPWNGSSPIV